MSTIVQRIRILPKELQVCIYEYNVEHRKQTNIINKEYLNIIYNPCRVCKKDFSKDIFCSTDYFINKKYNLSYYWCCDNCFDNDIDDISKSDYMVSIEKYFSKDTIRHKGEIIVF
jgi:hypothetical protein